jgi:hypothetical protein
VPFSTFILHHKNGEDNSAFEMEANKLTKVKKVAKITALNDQMNSMNLGDFGRWINSRRYGIKMYIGNIYVEDFIKFFMAPTAYSKNQIFSKIYWELNSKGL